MMALPLMLVGLTGVSTVATSSYLNGNAFQADDLVPVFGEKMPARKVLSGAGSVAMLLGALGVPFVGPIGAGLIFGSLANWDTTTRVEKGLTEFLNKQIAGPKTDVMPPQGGAAPAPGRPRGIMQDLFAPAAAKGNGIPAYLSALAT